MSRRMRYPESRSWLDDNLSWSTSVDVGDVLDDEAYTYGTNWKTLVRDLCKEVVQECSDDAATAFRRFVDIGRIVRKRVPLYHDALIKALLAQLRGDVARALNALKDGDTGLLVVRLCDALTHKDLVRSWVPDGFFEGLSQAHVIAVIERMQPMTADQEDERRIRPWLTDLVLNLEMDVLLATADRIGLWNKLDPVPVAARFLAERRCLPQFADIVVRALLQGRPGLARTELLDASLELCRSSGQSDMAQAILFHLFTETLGIAFAREWLSNHPVGADVKAAREYLFQRVRQHASRGRAMLFFADWPDLPQAAEIAAALPLAPDDLDPWQLEHASLALERRTPTIALKLLRLACSHPAHDLRRAEQHDEPRATGPAWFANWPNSLPYGSGQQPGT